ncbi:hypothetical protein Poli38472_009813 [Pythium oligandrum]|uniref:Endonuclease/exonuclease/phosphatase domain-containing protein n=1 Tax=Pythium oligandrum TaxID=41045 RepID=A0A8K1CFL7_PYTOL|nr:hypothetical protein Poli38472_009813 [Pythium oligandrum]|eukprot:TMW62320.1 hypothetical protein Poli38472_009813 [Pythium oligandrum]
MGVAEVIYTVRRRLALEILDLEPIPDPPPPRAEWPAWTSENASANQDVRLRVLSLNAWALPIAPKCTERAVEIANAIQEGYDIVTFQEIWHRRERNIIITRAEQAGYHYYHYFQPAVGFPLPLGAGAFGTGLLVVSKFPIVSAMYHPFSLSGRPYALHEADFVANKGVGLLRVQTPAGQFDLYVTHLIANYNYLGRPGPGDRYLAHRITQSYELARFINATNRNDLTVVCGDFNSPDDCLVLGIPRELVQLRDAFTDMNSHDGLTFATEDNIYSHGDHPMRMDYVLYKMTQQANDTPGWHLVGSDVFKGYFTDAKGQEFPLSDHFGVTAEFVFGSRPLPLKPCQQALGETSKEQSSPVAKNVPTCPTTTCMHCDELKAQTDGVKLTEDGYTRTVRLLQDIQQACLDGQAAAFFSRSAHLRRCAISAFLLLCLLVVHAIGLMSLSNWSWVAILLLVLTIIVQYVLAFFYITLELSSFMEMSNQVRLHLHAEQANQAVL